MTLSVSAEVDPPQSRAAGRWRRSSVVSAQPREVAALKRVLRSDEEYLRYSNGHAPPSAVLHDFLFADPAGGAAPEEVFAKLRWGGQYVYWSTSAAEVARRCQDFHARGGFVVERGPAMANTGPWGLPLPWLSRTVHYFVARKVCLVQPGVTTDRFTFDVQLIRRKTGEGYAVLKQVPTWKSVHQRLRERFPDMDQQLLASRAHKLVDHVFPVFLTREYAFLQLLQRDLPAPYNEKVPRPLAVEKDDKGFVRKLVMSWLRLGVPDQGPLPHLEFARQSADMVRVLHDIAHLIHLDLRLDNFVVTDKGVGLVDFGSAVRVGEDLAQSPMLKSLFDEMMSTHQMQRVLGRMSSSGQLTSSYLSSKQGKVDKAIDVFCLAVQLNRPHLNPDFVGLVDFDPSAEASVRLSLLTDAILRPKDPSRPSFISAQDVLTGVIRLQERAALGR